MGTSSGGFTVPKKTMHRFIFFWIPGYACGLFFDPILGVKKLNP